MSTTPKLEDVVRILRRHLPAGYEGVLFGSRATGRAGSRSDWDIGLLGPTPLRGAILAHIREDLDAMRTLHSFDVVDLGAVPDYFRRVALARAIILV
jgi:predicted nucleotidyltransferase